MMFWGFRHPLIILMFTIDVFLPQAACYSACPSGEKVTPFDATNDAEPSVWDGLTLAEIQEVQSYLNRQDDLNIQSDPSLVQLSDSYIYLIDVAPVSKQQVLDYLHNNGHKPTRYARAVILRGDLNKIQEYKVGPLPGVNTHAMITSPAYKQNLSYSMRNFFAYADIAAIGQLLSNELCKIHDLLLELTGYSFTNCTSNCLHYQPASPGDWTQGSCQLMVYLVRKVDGNYIQPIGLQLRINTISTNLSDWNINFVWFRGQRFTSIDDMKDNIDRRPFEHVNPVVYDPTDKTLFSAMHFRGNIASENPARRGPKSYMPDGRRFSVNKHHVDWQGWSFDFNIRSDVSLQLHDVSFRDERLIYELGLSEIAVVYSGATPAPLHTMAFDSPFVMGAFTLELFPGVDCPEHATFFDFAHFFGFGPLMNKNSACLFEADQSVPLRRFYENDFAGSYEWFHGMTNNVLILRAILTVGNYDYILDYLFHQNGALEVRVSLSGYILSSYHAGNRDDRFGMEIAPDVAGQIHNHLIQYKVDLDIIESSNRFQTLDIQLESVDDPLDNASPFFTTAFNRVLKETEREAALKYNFDAPKYLLFNSHGHYNKYGNDRAYRLVPVSMSKNLLPENWMVENSFTWARYQVAVTRQRDEEERGNSAYAAGSMLNPPFRFQDFIDDDENITDTDLVAWVTLGTFHIPHSEDVPIVNTPGVQLHFYLLPYNFFDEDISLASRDNVRSTPNKNGGHNVEYAIDSKPKCAPKPVDEQPRKSSSGNEFSKTKIFIILIVVLYYMVM